MTHKDRSGELRDRLSKTMGEEARIGMETATMYDHAQEALATEQEHVKDLTKRLGSEDTPELSEEYIEACNKVAGLQDLLASLSDDKEEGRRYRSGSQGVTE